MKIHLVTYATPRFRHRQIILGASAKLNKVVDSVTTWSPQKLNTTGFEQRVKDIHLDERGSGFWSWKPFIIQRRLAEVPDGDIVFYCDVGRKYPFKLLDQPIDPFLNWMDSQGQEIMPGVENAWDGPVFMWTKRDALFYTQMDRAEVHSATIIQAGFSFWRSGKKSREFVEKWMNLCSQRRLISDDASVCGLGELPGFRENRHDQSLLTLCCVKDGLRGLRFIDSAPPFDSGAPSLVSRYKFGDTKCRNLGGQLLRALVWLIQTVESGIRSKIKFGVAQS